MRAHYEHEDHMLQQQDGLVAEMAKRYPLKGSTHGSD